MKEKKPKQGEIEKVKPQNLEQKLTELIFNGALINPGAVKLLDEIRSAFPQHAGAITKGWLQQQIEKIVWTQTTLNNLRNAVKHGIAPEAFHEYNPHIPPQLIKEKIRWLRGVVSVSADQYAERNTLIKGLGRLSVEGTTKKDENFHFPESTLRHPYNVQIGDEREDGFWKFFLINGSNFGTLYNPLIEQNPLRLALACADNRGVEAVFITNLINVEFRKAVGSELHILKSFISGININPRVLSPYYTKDAERILESSPDNEVIYQLAAELVINIMTGLRKVSHKPIKNSKENENVENIKPGDWVPEYRGKVFIVFGHNEESLIANVAYWELKFLTDMRMKNLKTERNLVRLAIKRIEQGKAIERTGFSKGVSLPVNLESLKAKELQLEDAINRTRISLTSDEDRRRFATRLRSIVVRKIEEAIPNSKVIGQGVVNIKIGGKILQFNIPGHMKVSEGMLDSYVKTFGALSRRQEVPDAVLLCHPHSPNFRMAVREVSNQNQRGEVKIYTAPILVDGEFLRSGLKDSVRNAHPLARVVFNNNFCPGILEVNCVNGIINADRIGLDVLMNQSSPKRKLKEGAKSIADKYIYIMVGTDPHFGSRNRVEVWSAATGGALGVSDAVIQMMRDAGLCKAGKLPIHMFTVNDDPSQGNHFDTHKQPHPRQISYQEKERLVRGMKPEEAIRFLLEQDRLAGLDWLQEQILQVKERHIRPNLDFFENILVRVIDSGLGIKGISEIHKVPQDQRDIGAINWGTGNHLEATVDRNLTEGFIYRDYTKALLYGRNANISNEVIDKLVVAPLEGNQFFAWGYVKAPGGYEWAVELRSNPPRLSSWADVLKATVANDALRGDYGLFMTGHKTIKIYGDKHFFATVDIEDVLYHMCASGTSTDLYGHRGFPPNNTGVSFVGLPVGGPSAGPILIRPIHVQHILRYFEKPFAFDWEKFLPNPL
ncbi:MAG: hypothetical protein HY506_00925 [Candidatus Yanofskybacteria bacterium]|nr:hypothetical protein [Candidatus Yanofskybacteria bacterium]